MPSPSSAADDALDRLNLADIAQRDRQAFEQLYRRHRPRLTSFLRRFTPRHDLIDDVFNEAMWVVWRNADDFRGASKVGTWIIGIAYRCMLKALRASPSTEVNVSTLDAEQSRAYADVAVDPRPERELTDWVQSGLRILPDDQRVTIELAYFMGQSCEEIAEVMDCAVGTVKARLFHARVRLRNTLPALGGLGADATSRHG